MLGGQVNQAPNVPKKKDIDILKILKEKLSKKVRFINLYF